MNRKKIIIIILAIILFFGGSFLAYRKFFSKKETAPAEKNYFEINDEVSGVYFKVSKKFERMLARDLQIKNPNFLYGFSALDDKSVACYISQTKRNNAGVVKVVDLRDGIFEQVKKINSDAKLDSQEMIEVGENNNKGVKLKIRYTDVNVPKFQWETAGITQKTATFAFCEIPQAVIDLYEEDVNLFLNSVRLK